jgi:hypothetical protein
MTDVVGKDDEELGHVERLAGAKEDVRKDRAEERVGAPAGAMEEEYRVISVPLRVLMRLAESEVMELQFREAFAAAEAKILDNVCAVLGWPFSRGSLGAGCDHR